MKRARPWCKTVFHDERFVADSIVRDLESVECSFGAYFHCLRG